MFLGKFNIDDVITFAANTHDAASGAATDADAVPAYRVYEDETGTAILTGNMAKLDDANTTGFYSEQLTLSAANGFENGKSYTVYVSAAVDSVTGTMHHTFSMGLQKVDATHWGGTAVASANVLIDGAITAAKIATGAIDADAIADNAIDAGAIASDAITAAKIADGAIDAATFAAGAITAAAIATNAIDDDALASDAVTAIQSGLATSSALSTAQSDLDILTGTDGATLATSQPNYAPAVAGDAMNLANDAITAGKFDESTAFPVTSADSSTTRIARTGADSDTLETLSDEIAVVDNYVDTEVQAIVNTLVTVEAYLAFLVPGVVTEYAVDDASATTTSFVTTLPSTIDDFYNDMTLEITSGTLASQSRIVTGYTQATKTITLDEALSAAPANGVTFKMRSTHTHPVSQIIDAVWDEPTSGHTTSGTFGEQLKTDVDAILVDTAEIGAAGAGLTNINLPDQAMNITGDITGNLSGSVGSVTGAVGSVTGAVGSVTGNVGGNVTGSVGSLATQAKADVNAEVVDVLRTDTLPDSYAADGSQPTIAQAVLMIAQFLMERSVSGTTLTVKKPDGSTTAMTFTLNDGTSPTAITRG